MNETIAWPNEDNEPVLVDDAHGNEIEVRTDDSSDEGPIFVIHGGLTLAQLHRVTHLLTQLMCPGVSVQTTATWARDERQGRVRE